MATSLASLHHAWTPKAVPLARKTPPPVGQAATPEDVLAVLPILKSTALLIHCLQSERGVTCGWLASVTEQTLFSEALPVCRAETDAALGEDRNAEVTVQAALAALRAAVDAAHEDADARAEAFMETFTGYDELIADVQAELLSRDLATSTATTILAAFSQLKDAVGVVRAFVAAALVMPPESLATLSGRMRGTLIVCVHRQRACTATIRASAPRKLLSLVGAGFGARALITHSTPSFHFLLRLRRAPPTATTHPSPCFLFRVCTQSCRMRSPSYSARSNPI